MTGEAVAEFIANGSLAAHHARAARTYAARRARLVAALGRHLPGHRLSGVDAGLHLVLLLPDDVDDHEVSMGSCATGCRSTRSPPTAWTRCAAVSSSGMPACRSPTPTRPCVPSPADCA